MLPSGATAQQVTINSPLFRLFKASFIEHIVLNIRFPVLHLLLGGFYYGKSKKIAYQHYFLKKFMDRLFLV